MAAQKKMNLVQLTFIVAVNMMGSGIIMLPTNMAEVGAISLLSWIVTALGSMAIAYGFAQAGLFNQRKGGMAAYAADAYGKSGYFVMFYLYFLSLGDRQRRHRDLRRGLSGDVLPLALVDADRDLHRRDRRAVAHDGWPTSAAPPSPARIGSITVWGVILPVGFLSIFGWFWFSSETFAAAWNPQGHESRRRAWGRASR